MRNSSRIILYVFLLILISFGLALILGRNNIRNFLEARTDSLVTASPPTASSSARDVLDSSALESPRFKSLVNNVINFDFANICWRPDAVSQPLATDAASSAPHCVQGNNTPFFANIK